MPKNVLAFLLFIAAMSAPALAQTYSPPRTPQGHADFTGVWSAAFVTPFERPKSETRPALTGEEAKAFATKLSEPGKVEDPDFAVSNIKSLSVVRGEQRTSIIIDPPDGRMPLTQEGEKLSAQDADAFENGYDDPEIRPASERCVGGLGSPPMRILPIVIPLQIVQTHDHVVLLMEDVAGFRFARFDPTTVALPSFEGSAAARFDGDTLVVTSKHFRGDMLFREQLGQSVIVGPGTTITERFTRLSDREMLYEFTVDDARYYTRPWRGEFVFTRLDTPVMEYSCHEANYSLPNILRGGQAEAKKKAKEKK